MKETDLDRWLDIQVDRFPFALRRRVGECVSDVQRISDEFGLQRDISSLLKTFRTHKQAIAATEIPLPLALWIALDRLDCAYVELHRFDPIDYLSKSVMVAAFARARGREGTAPDYTPARSGIARKETKRRMSIYVARKLEAAEAAFGDRSPREIAAICVAHLARQGLPDVPPTLSSRARELVAHSFVDGGSPSEAEIVRYMEAKELSWTEQHSPIELLSEFVDRAVSSVRPRKLPGAASPKAPTSRKNDQLTKYRSIWRDLVELGYEAETRGRQKKIADLVCKRHGCSDSTIDRVKAAGRKGQLDLP